MNNISNRRIYRLLAPLYDLFFQPIFARPRRHLLLSLDLQPGERLLIPGAGTGQDLPLLPSGLQVVAGDLSWAMLSRAIGKGNERSDVHFQILDGQQLPFADRSFDAVLLFLLLSVVPDGGLALEEVWRVLREGGRVAIFDKFLPQGQTLTPVRRLIGQVIRRLGTDSNRGWEEMSAGIPSVAGYTEQPSLFHGQYRMIWLEKQRYMADKQEKIC